VGGENDTSEKKGKRKEKEREGKKKRKMFIFCSIGEKEGGGDVVSSHIESERGVTRKKKREKTKETAKVHVFRKGKKKNHHRVRR